MSLRMPDRWTAKAILFGDTSRPNPPRSLPALPLPPPGPRKRPANSRATSVIRSSRSKAPWRDTNTSTLVSRRGSTGNRRTYLLIDTYDIFMNIQCILYIHPLTIVTCTSCMGYRNNYLRKIALLFSRRSTVFMRRLREGL